MQMQQASRAQANSAGRLRVLFGSISQLTRLADKPLQASSESPASTRSGESEASHQHEPSAETVTQTCAHDILRLLLDVIEDRLVEVSSSVETPFEIEHSTKLWTEDPAPADSSSFRRFFGSENDGSVQETRRSFERSGTEDRHLEYRMQKTTRGVWHRRLTKLPDVRSILRPIAALAVKDAREILTRDCLRAGS
ncbi:hypothetical protein BCR37DRAFT_197755 [Protomyces lactucae-debilis]|uniref:Uncharacterized protein n=1 Tax=Protomyces lactucae-debilis TaxID=2754530 RepID=A0A1Y2ESM4_PROLT|nr:uncharacterized protein BCR37DRAFT_197755 [Protomyces lactucae-debilis]ORY74563.1 hypothetical protein BCR37DRAFT_197755 [Protomyces lactucae-debilis]